MTDDGELAELRAEVETLREEVRLLRASQPVTWYQPAPYANACAGGYVPQTVHFNTACGDQPVYDATRMTAGAAGCAGMPQVTYFNTGYFG